VKTSLGLFCLLVLGLLSACAGDKKAAPETGQKPARPSPPGRPGVFTTPAADPATVRVQPDSDRTTWAVFSTDGGSLTATAADGTRLVLTIPRKALLGPEEIRLTPVTSLRGLPGGASTVAAAELGPDGLLLLQPATLEITPPNPVDQQSSFPLAWSASGEDLHLHPLIPRPGGIRFQVSHFSGFAIASGSDAAMDEILKKEPQDCGDRYFREIVEVLAANRRAALMGEEGGISQVIDRFVQLSQSYLADIIQPVAAQVSQDDAQLPCLKAELATFERTFRLLAGDSLAQTLLAKPLADAWDKAYQASGSAFEHAAQRCLRNESPAFQFQLMANLSSFLANAGRQDLLPEDSGASLVECSRKLEYQVDIESAIQNTYREQGRGNDFTSSMTTVRASGIRVVYNEQRSTQTGTPTFLSLEKARLDATVTAVPRQPCPDQVRVQPGSNVEVTLTPILNSRVGKLICRGGKAHCDASDLNPGVMVQLSPNVVEEMYVHTKTSSGCMNPGGWNEWMMFWEGSQSTGAFEPFQVRGDHVAVTIVRKGTGTRGYLQLPDLERSLSRTKASVKVVRGESAS
jgi:hypothetical protein